jgi:hypothetical protein
MSGKQPWWLATLVAVTLSGSLFVACGGPKTQDPPVDAGVDAGTAPGDAGTDAGHQDPPVDAGTDAGGDPDAGQDPDAGMDPDAGQPDAGCGQQTQVFHQVRDEGIGFPLSWSQCNADGCEQIITERFVDQQALDNFYQNELQAQPPVINFAAADVVVSYSCICSSFGYELKTQDVVEDACALSTVTELTVPGEGCGKLATVTRPYTTVEIPKGAGINVQTQATITVYSCG